MVCIHTVYTEIKHEMWTQVLPELNICSDGIMVDLTPPTPGQVWIGNVQGTKFQVSFLVSLISQAQVTGKDIRSQVDVLFDSQIILQVRHSGKGWYLTWSNTCPHYDQSLYFIKAKTYLDYIFCRKCWSLKSGFFVLDLWRHVNEQIPVISQTNEKIVFFLHIWASELQSEGCSSTVFTCWCVLFI